MSDPDKPSAIEFWDYCHAVHELAVEHSIRVRTIQARYDFVNDAWDEKKAEDDFNGSVKSLLNQFELLNNFHGFPAFSELEFMHETVARMADLLKGAVIYRSLNSGMFGRHDDDWSKINFELHRLINCCAQENPDIQEVVYQRALDGIEIAALKPPNETQADVLPKLSKKKRRALEIIIKDGPILGRQIAQLLDIEESTFYTHYIKDLRLHGVRNDEVGQGYYHNPPKCDDATEDT